MGMCSPVIITSDTLTFSRSPRLPPGWFLRKSLSLNFLRLSKTTARASPIARAAVVLAVGASPRGHASFGTATFKTASARLAMVDSEPPVIAIIETFLFFRLLSSRFNSAVSPLYEMARTTSLGSTMPRSPCIASTGCRKKEAVPVLFKVAAIF